jgi:hypothetical protein
MTNHPMMKCGCAAQGVLTAKGGVKIDPPIPSCLVHDCYEVASAPPDLTGRVANCVYGDHARKPSDPENLAFFEYRGPGSKWATDYCKCGYTKGAHDKPNIKCKFGGFTERGPHERDVYYCGCHGWD